MKINILAIESSCDETSASVIQNGKILANVIATQAVHEKYGGVVPELASREHQKNIIPVVNEAFSVAKIQKNDLSAVAYTQGPGLLGSLLVGSSFAKAVATANNLPLIGVHHMQAHILAHFIDDPKPTFPFLCLTVSGGHTQLVVVRDYLEMEVVGTTQDDAVGEAFDKTAKLLDLPYPGGPHMDKQAKSGDPEKFSFSKTEMDNYDFSFSGIKTSVLYFLQKEMRKNENFINENINDLCASIQSDLIDMLMVKLIRAARDYGINEIAIAGGVAANSGLRNRLASLAKDKNWNIYIPEFQYCTDNAAMIAQTAWFKFQRELFVDSDATTDARLPFPL